MRDIEFRAKCTDNGKWVYGYYVEAETLDKSGVEYFIIEKSADGETHIIDSETVGQYTGLTDKNGKKIFEGDIVEYKEEYGEIMYDKELAMFIVQFDTWCTDFDHIYPYSIEVIDNIHNSPESLEVVIND